MGLFLQDAALHSAGLAKLMAMARKSMTQHPNAGHDVGPLTHSNGTAKVASVEPPSASVEELRELGMVSQTSVHRDSQKPFKLPSSVTEKADDTGERQSGLLHHLKTGAIHPGLLTGLNSASGRSVDDTVLDYDSGYEYTSTSSFEFQRGERGVPRPIVASYLKSAPSKWDDAEKWLVSQSPGEVTVKGKTKSGPLNEQGSLAAARRVAFPNQQDWHSHFISTKNGYQANGALAIPNGSETLLSADGRHSIKVMSPSFPEQNYDLSGERMKKMDAVKGVVNGTNGAHNFAFIPVPAPPAKGRHNDSRDRYPVADEPDDKKEVNISHEGKEDEPLVKPMLRTEKPTSDSLVSASFVTPAPALRSVSMRDMGTEMTPIASQEPSRTGTPIRATTPTIRSPVSSGPSTPRRSTPAPSPRQDSENVLAPDGINQASELSEKEMQVKTRREIQVLGAQLGKVNIAAWASKEEEDADASKSLKNIDLDEVRKNVLETRAAAWEEAEQAKYMARFKREEAKIQAWENHERARAEAEMRRIEVKVEKKRSHAHAKLMNKLAAARRRAEERRAAAEEKRCEQAAKTAQRADHIRHTGRMPSSFFSCAFCH